MFVFPVVVQVLAHFIDCVFGGSEKDKVTALLKAVLFNIWPHLHNHRYEKIRECVCVCVCVCVWGGGGSLVPYLFPSIWCVLVC